jgi:DNA polymerase-3 subunit delta'
VEEIAKQGREKQKQFLRYVNHILEECLRLGVLGERETSLLPQEREFCLKLNKMASPGQVEAIIRELDNAAYYIERNAHAKMLFQALTIKIYYILRDNSVILIH